MHSLRVVVITSALSILCGIAAFSQSDNVGSGRAISFDGLDDFITLGNVYDDLVLPVSIEAWIKIDPNVNYTFPIFTSQDNLPLYNGVNFHVNPTSMAIGYGDGQGEDNPVFRRDKSVLFNSNISNRWLHVVGVVRAATDMDLYVNGVNVGGYYTGSSNLPMSSNSAADFAKIGYWLSNGITARFKGVLDELRIWNRSITESEIRTNMCRKLLGSETGLIGYWTFDEITGNTVFDKSPNQHHGTLIGNPLRVFSGAPIGDYSILHYTNNWTGFTLSLTDTVRVSNITGNPLGAHLYRVDQMPSQTGGLNLSDISVPYYGVFFARGSTEINFKAFYHPENECQSFNRLDNSISNWVSEVPPYRDRVELVKRKTGLQPTASLGQDEVLCDISSKTLNAVAGPDGLTFLWSTGETTQTIDVTSNGIYWVTVTSGCFSDKDSITLAFETTPLPLNLGADLVTCEIGRIKLLVTDSVGKTIQWNDGINSPSRYAEDFGQYWVEVSSQCGTVRDTLTITQQVLDVSKIPNIITPNGDELNEVFIVEPPLKGSTLYIYDRWGKLVYDSKSYQNDWNGHFLSAGIYFWRAKGSCFNEAKGSVSIVR
jgi:gliding motility-associated-like protein